MELPRLAFYPIPSFNVPLGVMIPKQVENLLVVEKSISVSNIMNGATRLQPVVMQIGQAAGQLAAMAVEQNCPPREVKVRDVQKALLSSCHLMPYLDLEVSDPHLPLFSVLARRASCEEGKNVNWSMKPFVPRIGPSCGSLWKTIIPARHRKNWGSESIPRSDDPGEYAVAIDSILHPLSPLTGLSRKTDSLEIK